MTLPNSAHHSPATRRPARTLLALLAMAVVLIVAPVAVATKAISPRSVASDLQTKAVRVPGSQEAERILKRLGCAPGRTDGMVDVRVRAAAMRFQAANDLKQTGRVVGVQQQFATHQIRCDDRPLPANSGSGRRIVVDIPHSYLWVVNANGTVARQMPIISQPSNDPAGVYSTGSYCGRPSHVAKNSDYSGQKTLNYFTRWGACGYGFHEIPLLDGRYTNPAYALGTHLAESAGCIQMKHEDAKYIYQLTQSRSIDVHILN